MKAGDTPFVKIGRSTNIEKRRQTLQSTSIEKIQILAALDLEDRWESTFHVIFSEYRESGEWFRIDGILAQYLQGDHGSLPAIQPYIPPPSPIKRAAAPNPAPSAKSDRVGPRMIVDAPEDTSPPMPTVAGSTHIIDTLKSIREWARQRDLTGRMLALQAGLNRNTLRGFEDPNWNPTAETIRALQNVILREMT